MVLQFLLRKSGNTKLILTRASCGITRRLQQTSTNLTKDSLFKELPVEAISPKSKDPIAGRKWLPGSQGEGFPEFLGKPKKGFPHALMAQSADRYSIEERAQVAKQVIEEDLTKYGAVVFRGLGLRDTEDISKFAIALGYKGMEYVGGAANRQEVNSKAHVYTASDDPSAYTIELHNELAYAPVYPRKLMFYCLDEPGEGCGGFTVMSKSADFVAKLHPDVMRKLEEMHVRYLHRVPDIAHSKYLSWQQMFETTDKAKVESFLETNGFTFSWENEIGSLSFWITLPAFIPHPDTGEKIWFNHIHKKHFSAFQETPMFQGGDSLDSMYVYYSYYGDGSEIEPEVIQHIRACIWQCAIGFQWRQGDVLLIDNMTTLHGRLGYNGKRQILATLFQD